MCIVGVPVHDWCDCAKALEPVVYRRFPRLPKDSRKALWTCYKWVIDDLLSCHHHVELDCDFHFKIRLATEKGQEQMKATLRGALWQPHWIHCDKWFDEGALRGPGEHACPDTIRRWGNWLKLEAFCAVPTPGNACPSCLPMPNMDERCSECWREQEPAINKGTLHMPTPSRHSALMASYKNRNAFAPIGVKHVADKRTIQAMAETRARGAGVHICWDRTAESPQRPIVYLLHDPPSLELDPEAPAASPSQQGKRPCLRGAKEGVYLYDVSYDLSYSGWGWF